MLGKESLERLESILVFEASGQRLAQSERARASERLLSNREERGVEEFEGWRPKKLGKKETRNRGSQRRRLRGQ